MIYWHIQMNQPWGRDGGTIQSIDMLRQNPPVIGTGEWDDIQCYYFTGENPNGLKLGDIVLVHEGQRPIALCRIASDCFQDPALLNTYHHENYRRVEVLEFYNGNDTFPQPQGTLERLINKGTSSWKFINTWYHQHKKAIEMKKYIDPLIRKKQIILQGPPGTGKTYNAKRIAIQLMNQSPGAISIDALEIKRHIKVGQNIPTSTGQTSFDIIAINANGITVHPVGANNNYDVSFTEISTAYQTKKWQGQIVGGRDTYIAGTAKFLSAKVNSKYIKLLQFHPSYSYEDFVRGISAEPNGANGLKYDVVDRILTKIASDAETDVDANYILIIDEINRANLPSVLGELIYALEYRGDAVEGLYEQSGKRSILLPNNLYVIGTMNTADRSVGHIDYAIRRRFAFIDVLPDSSVITSDKAKEFFAEIEKLFVDYLAPDFEKEQVMLGHSYFLAESNSDLKMKLCYEVYPILKEYLNDGVLVKNDTTVGLLSELLKKIEALDE